MNDLDTKTTW